MKNIYFYIDIKSFTEYRGTYYAKNCDLESGGRNHGSDIPLQELTKCIGALSEYTSTAVNRQLHVYRY